MPSPPPREKLSGALGTVHVSHTVLHAGGVTTRIPLIPTSANGILIHFLCAGGVACNDYVAHALEFICNTNNCRLHRPSAPLCTDNGIMIAWNGVELLRAGHRGARAEAELAQIDLAAMAPFGVDIRNEVAKANIKLSKCRIPFPSKTANLAV